MCPWRATAAHLLHHCYWPPCWPKSRANGWREEDTPPVSSHVCPCPEGVQSHAAMTVLPSFTCFLHHFGSFQFGFKSLSKWQWCWHRGAFDKKIGRVYIFLLGGWFTVHSLQLNADHVTVKLWNEWKQRLTLISPGLVLVLLLDSSKPHRKGFC